MNDQREEKRTLMVFDTIKDIADYTSRELPVLAGEAMTGRGVFTIALSSGRTPILVYEEWVKRKRNFPWDRVHIFWADERFVPRDNAFSNYRLIREMLLDGIPIPPENVHPVPLKESACLSAESYEDELRRFFGKDDLFPAFDLIMLGIGRDGHTASLFPGDPALNERTRWCACVHTRPGVELERITLTLPVINNARTVMFLATGGQKKEAVKEVLENRDPRLPAAQVVPENGQKLFLLDRDAASLLEVPVS
jgi:6-phosphogluconolactonase